MKPDQPTPPAQYRPGDQAWASRIAPIGGLTVAAGAILYIIHIVGRSVLTAGPTAVEAAQHALWVPVNAIGAIGALLALVGFPAIFPRLAGHGGLPSLIGFALVGASWAFFGVFLSLYGTLILPWLANQAPSLAADSASASTALAVTFAMSLIAWLGGSVLLATPYLRGALGPTWIGYALPMSALWFLIGSFVIAPDGPASNLAINLVSNLGPVLLLAGPGFLGMTLWHGRTSVPATERRPQWVKSTADSIRRA